MRGCVFAALIAAVTFGGVPAYGAESAESAAPVNDEQTDKILKAMSDYYAKLNTFAVNFEVKMNAEENGDTQSLDMGYSVVMERPNKFAITTKGVQGISLISDGKTVYTSIPEAATYVEETAPATIADLAKVDGFQMIKTGDMALVLASDKPYETFMAGIRQGKYLGLEEVDGVSCHHMRFTQDELDWDLWVRQGEEPVVTKVVPDVAKTLHAAGEDDLRMNLAFLFTNWRPNATLPPGSFTFAPPADAKKYTWDELLADDAPK